MILLSLLVYHLILLAPAAATTTAAGPDPAESEHVEEALVVLRARMKLSDDQVEKMRPLMLDHFKALRAILESYVGQSAVILPSVMHEFQGRRDQFQKEVAPFLTEEQREEFLVIRKEVDLAIRDLICNKRVDSLKKRLKLSEAQVTEVRPIIIDDFKRKRTLMSIHTSETGGPAVRRPLAPEYQKIQAETDERLRTVLSAEQMKEYSVYMDERRQASG
jgi:hypothetical protein